MLGFFGLMAWGYAALCGRAIYLAGKLPPAESIRNADVVSGLWLQLAVAVLAGAGMLWYGWRLALKADMRDAGNRRKPMIRF